MKLGQNPGSKTFSESYPGTICANLASLFAVGWAQWFL